MKFESLNLNVNILKGIRDANFERCTPVQEQSLPECLQGMDIIAQSQTGTGKTAVFLLTIFHKLIGEDSEPSKKPRALIMAPTRELAVQIEKEAQTLGKYLPLKSVAVYGGVEYDKQVGAFKEGVDIVVATPGRFIDLYKGKTISLDKIEVFVVDEADRMFDMGFAPDITYIAGRLPKKTPRQTLLFSATIDSNVRRLADRYMKPDPVEIEIDPDQLTVEAIDQRIIYVSNDEKIASLMTLLSRPDVERVIVFTNMKRTAEEVEWKLKENGFPAKVLTGDVTQARRQKTIDAMKSGDVKILVATDVAARGLHIEDVSHVINYDLPEEAASYVHRIGRTARAGKSGTAYSLGCETYVINLPEIERYIEHKIEKEWIEESELIEDKSGSFRSRRRAAAGRDRKGSDRKGSGRKDAHRSSDRKREAGSRRPPKGESKKESTPKASSLPRETPRADSKPGRLEKVKPEGAGPEKAGAAGGGVSGNAGETKKEGAAAEGTSAEKTAKGRPRRRRRRSSGARKAQEGKQTSSQSGGAKSGEAKSGEAKSGKARSGEEARKGGGNRHRNAPGKSTSPAKGRPRRRPGGSKPKPLSTTTRKGSSDNPEDRLAYYRKRYGEDASTAKETKPGGLLKRITSVFRRKES